MSGATSYERKPTDPAPEPGKRECLKCGEKFMSKHRFNRICQHCKAWIERNNSSLEA